MVPGMTKPGGNRGKPFGNWKPKPGTAGETPIELCSRSLRTSGWRYRETGVALVGGSRVERGPCWPPLSVAMRRLIAVYFFVSMHMKMRKGFPRNKNLDGRLPLDDTPAPISMSGSSTTSPVSMAFPPLPPYSAVNIHFRSASVKRSIGMILIPV